jgi:hypothetical protein
MLSSDKEIRLLGRLELGDASLVDEPDGRDREAS